MCALLSGVFHGRWTADGGCFERDKTLTRQEDGSAVEWDWGTLGFDRESRTVRKTF